MIILPSWIEYRRIERHDKKFFIQTCLARIKFLYNLKKFEKVFISTDTGLKTKIEFSQTLGVP